MIVLKSSREIEFMRLAGKIAAEALLLVGEGDQAGRDHERAGCDRKAAH